MSHPPRGSTLFGRLPRGAPQGVLVRGTDTPECPLWVRPEKITCVILASLRAEGRANQCSHLLKGLSSLITWFHWNWNVMLMVSAIFPIVFGDSKQSFPQEKANGVCDTMCLVDYRKDSS